MSLLVSSMAWIIALYLLTPPGRRQFIKAIEFVEKFFDDRALRKLKGKPVLLDELFMDIYSKD